MILRSAFEDCLAWSDANTATVETLVNNICCPLFVKLKPSQFVRRAKFAQIIEHDKGKLRLQRREVLDKEARHTKDACFGTRTGRTG